MSRDDCERVLIHLVMEGVLKEVRLVFPCFLACNAMALVRADFHAHSVRDEFVPRAEPPHGQHAEGGPAERAGRVSLTCRHAGQAETEERLGESNSILLFGCFRIEDAEIVSEINSEWS